MRPEPPANLIQLLERLRLATPEQVAAAGRRARHLVGDLPDFESVWVDTLAQQRILTPFQAAEINAGRGPGLLQGPYRIHSRLPGPHFAECFAAEQIDDRRLMRLYVVRGAQRNLAVVGNELQLLVARGAALGSAGALCDFGIQDSAAWAVCDSVAGTTAGDWLVENGRLPPQAVMQIARDMVAQLAELESYGIVHGDLGASTLLLRPSGEIAIPAPGLRPIVRPQEGYGACDLRPEAYDYLAPERIAAGVPPSVTTDIYACGCLWWHLLAGRAPFAGGNSLAKLKSIQAGRLVDVRPFAPTASETLLQALQLCLHDDPTQRPQSFAHLQELLGAPTPAGRALVANLLRGPDAPRYRPRHVPRRRTSSLKRSMAIGTSLTTALCGLVMAPYLFRERAEAPPAIAARLPEPIATSPTNIHTAGEAKVLPRVDTQVKPAVANLPVEQVVEDLVLPASELLRVEHLDLKPHIRVRGRGGSRPKISVPRGGLLIGCDDVTFDGVDFVWDGSASGSSGGPAAAAMLHLQAPTANFRGCSFSSPAGNAPAAIHVASVQESLPGLGGELAFTNCVFDGVSAVLEVATRSSLTVRMNHCLCVAAGPMLRLSRPPSPESRVALTLDHVTTRGDSSVLECHYGRKASQSGAIAISASNSALAGGGRGGLTQLVGVERPDPLTATISWSGQGAIALPNTPLMVWRNPEIRSVAGQRQAMPEEGLEVAGLVRGELEFAGRPDGPPAASRVTRWQVPLRSPDPPGADPNLLSSPRGNSPL